MASKGEPVTTHLSCFKRGKLVACTLSEFYGVPMSSEDDMYEHLEKLGFSLFNSVKSMRGAPHTI